MNIGDEFQRAILIMKALFLKYLLVLAAWLYPIYTCGLGLDLKIS